MVFGSTLKTAVCSELQRAIRSELHGTVTLLTDVEDKLFYPRSDADKLLLKSIANSFSSIAHDLVNIRTGFLRMETLTSVPDIEANRLANFLAADVDQFFSLVQSMFDYLSEAITLLFPYRGRKPVSFVNLREHYKSNYESDTDGLFKKLREEIQACDWPIQLREIRNQLIHGGAEAYTLVDERGEDILFQILAGDNPLLLRDRLDEKLFAVHVPTYVSFKAYAGLVLGRLFDFFDRIAEIYLQKLSEQIDIANRTAYTQVILPNMAIAIDWIEFSLSRLIESTVDLNVLNNNAGSTKFAINKQSLLLFIDKLLGEALTSDKHSQQRSIVKIDAFIKILTNRHDDMFMQSLQNQSIHSFRSECARRRYRMNINKQLQALLSVLKRVRQDLLEGKIKSFGQIDVVNWTLADLEMMITPVLTT